LRRAVVRDQLTLIKMELLARGSSGHEPLTMDQVAAAIVTRKLEGEPKRCPHFACHNRDVVDHNLKCSLVKANPRPATTWEPEGMRVEMVMRCEQ
jgi:hypothetical protein